MSFGHINNEEGFLKEVQLAKGLGFNGKSLVNPRQIELLHQAYSPTRKEVEYAYEVIAAAEEAASRGSGASFHQRQMWIDGPDYRPRAQKWWRRRLPHS